MLAELHGKVSRSAAWEDTLTEAVFGSVKYLPRRKVLLPLLKRLFPSVKFPLRDIDGATFEFWPKFASGAQSECHRWERCLPSEPATLRQDPRQMRPAPTGLVPLIHALRHGRLGV